MWYGRTINCKNFKRWKDKLVNHPRLILQSNIQTQALRQTLNKLSYEIVDERIIEEKGHIYEIVVAEFNNNLVKLNILQEKFGPFYLEIVITFFKNGKESYKHCVI